MKQQWDDIRQLPEEEKALFADSTDAEASLNDTVGGDDEPTAKPGTNPYQRDDALSTEMLKRELRRRKYRARYLKLLTGTLYALVVVAAFSILLSTLLFPVLKIYGTSMTPCLQEGDVAITLKYSELQQGDVIAFYYNNHILVKRIIATGGQTVYIDEDGVVSVDNVLLDETYTDEKSFGNSDLEYPYTVPENTYFVLGDNRESSVDSRSSVIGCIGSDEIVGEVAFVMWPLSHIGTLN